MAAGSEQRLATNTHTNMEAALCVCVCVCVCVCSNSRNEVPRVAQRYGTIAEHIRRRLAPILVAFVVFCVHIYSFAG